jgi:hypothetical protein
VSDVAKITIQPQGGALTADIFSDGRPTGTAYSARRSVMDWLEDWVDNNLQVPEFVEEDEMEAEAAICIKDALDAGYSETHLINAVDGTLKSFLCRRQNEFTEARIAPAIDD